VAAPFDPADLTWFVRHESWDPLTHQWSDESRTLHPADTESVRWWEDTSGNSRDLYRASNIPTRHDYPARATVRYNATNAFHGGEAAYTPPWDAMTMYVLACVTAIPAADKYTFALGNAGGTRTHWIGANAAGNWQGACLTSGYATRAVTGSAIVQDQWRVLTLTVAAGGNVEFYIENVSQGTIATASAAHDSDRHYINAMGGTYMAVDVIAFMVAPSVHTAGNMANMYTYLNALKP
jgi:hypothetical protein